MKKLDSHLGDVIHCRRRGDGTTEGSILPKSNMEVDWLGLSYSAWLKEYGSVVLDLQRRRVPSLEVELATVNLRYGRVTAVSYEAAGDE